MALIKCPECGKEISDKSEKCIHCGYPLVKEKNTICNINGKKYDLSYILDFYREHPDGMIKVKLIGDFRKMVGCSLSDAKKVIDEIIETNEIPKVLILKQQEIVTKKEENNIPHCPTCGSTNIEKISSTKRWLSTGLFGLASSDVGKTMVCKKCRYKW